MNWVLRKKFSGNNSNFCLGNKELPAVRVIADGIGIEEQPIKSDNNSDVPARLGLQAAAHGRLQAA
jgi:PPE-repeat protein